MCIRDRKAVETIRKGQLEFCLARMHTINQCKRLDKELDYIHQTDLRNKLRLIKVAQNQSKIKKLRDDAIKKQRDRQYNAFISFEGKEEIDKKERKYKAEKLTKNYLEFIVLAHAY
eukprot:TRINITY_DN2958_c0_g7_i1.p1 TRINITY_DN2958_c0_g7~~TRINITY_DN2958_c0_g7_i1.p1  ORF type:complete len:116 (+),score=20.99 TRINITY_DN2958_c0_g7_i1:73-420(+)